MSVFMFTHQDLDAVGSVIIAKWAKLMIKSIEYHDYTSIDQALLGFLGRKDYHPTDLLLITDICPSQETCDRIDKIAGKEIEVKLLDHHATKAWLTDYSWAVFDTTKSGALLTLNYLFQKEKDPSVEIFTQAVNAWDLWKVESEYRSRGEDLNSLLYSIGRDEFIEAFARNIKADEEEGFKFLLEFSKKRKRKAIRQAVQAQYKKAKVYVDNENNQFVVAFATEFISDIAHAILEDENYNDIKYVLVVNPLGDTCSLRSRTDSGVNVALIAQRFGGGGHVNAAGFPFPMKDPLEDTLFKMLNRDPK